MKKWLDSLSIKNIVNLITTFKDKDKMIIFTKEEICFKTSIYKFKYNEENSEYINLYNGSCEIDLKIENGDYIFIYDENSIRVKISDYVELQINDIEYDEFIKQYEIIKASEDFIIPIDLPKRRRRRTVNYHI